MADESNSSDDQPTRPGDPRFSDTPSFPDTPTEMSGMVIGPYQLMQKIGEGGFGSVWMARQREPIQRRVALKLIKLGMDTREVMARFETERQALAMMDHPGIAKVLDAGSTVGGRPYFVMELVRGEPILTYCDNSKLNIRARLKLFIKVCNAIQHAHQKGIIHRDIKPSNILVSEQEGTPVPRVIDFGVAKATHSDLTQNPFFTRLDRVVGTPAYMSPEQAFKTGLDIDTRSDIYSLGILLYELLAGATPFDFDLLSQLGYSEMMRVLNETEFPRPSTRFSTLGPNAGRAASLRRTDVRDLKRTLRGDLDWIVMQCLEKDRSRRYQTAVALAEDIQRYLDDKPVTAGPPSTGYRMRKFARRHRTAVAAGAVVAAVLVLGVVGTTLGMVRALREQARATQAMEELEQVTAFQESRLREIDIRLMGERIQADILARRHTALTGRGVDERTLVAAMADMGSSHAEVNFTDVARKALDENIFEQALTAIETDFSDRPKVKARLLQTVADTMRSLGLLERAVAPQQQALEIRRNVLGPEHPDTLHSINSLADLLQAKGDFAAAQDFARESLAVARRVLGNEHPNTLTAINNVGFLLRRQGRLAEAETYYREALETRRRTLGNEDALTLISIGNLSALLQSQGRFSEAEELLREALEIRRRTLGNEDPGTLTSINNMGFLLWGQGRHAEAEVFYREVVAGRRRTLGDEHPHTLLSINNMGRLLMDMGSFTEAEPLIREATDGRRRILGAEHPDTLASIITIGLLHRARGNLVEAESILREGLELRRRVLGEQHHHTLATLDDLGAVLREQGRNREAVELLSAEESSAIRILTDASPQRLASFLCNLGRTRIGLGRPADLAVAEKNLLQAHALFEQIFGAEDPRTIDSVHALIELYQAREAAEPDGGHDAAGAQWQKRLAGSQSVM